MSKQDYEADDRSVGSDTLSDASDFLVEFDAPLGQKKTPTAVAAVRKERPLAAKGARRRDDPVTSPGEGPVSSPGTRRRDRPKAAHKNRTPVGQSSEMVDHQRGRGSRRGKARGGASKNRRSAGDVALSFVDESPPNEPAQRTKMNRKLRRDMADNSCPAPGYGTSPVYGTGPVYGPGTGPVYGPGTGPVYGPSTSPVYGPGPVYCPVANSGPVEGFNPGVKGTTSSEYPRAPIPTIYDFSGPTRPKARDFVININDPTDEVDDSEWTLKIEKVQKKVRCYIDIILQITFFIPLLVLGIFKITGRRLVEPIIRAVWAALISPIWILILKLAENIGTCFDLLICSHITRCMGAFQPIHRVYITHDSNAE